MAVANVGAHALGGVGEHLVEARPLHLVRRAPPRRELVAEVELTQLPVPTKRRAVLVLEAGLDHVLQHARLFDERHAVRQEALADDEARKRLLLDDDDLAAGLSQHARGDGARWTCPSDDDLRLLDSHADLLLA